MRVSHKGQVVQKAFENFVDSECPNADKDEAFTLFAGSQAVRDGSLGSDLIGEGIVDGPRDGGIDAIFVFLNGMLLPEDSPYLDESSEAIAELTKSPVLEIQILQCKNSAHWDEGVWGVLALSIPELFDINADEAALSGRYNSRVVTRSGIYRSAMRALALKFPVTKVRVSYASLSDEGNITSSLDGRRAKLEEMLGSATFAESEVALEHVGIESLYTLLARPESRTTLLSFEELIRTDGAYIGLVNISDYLEFLKTDEGVLSQDLFNANVRDYEGSNQVNESIFETLADEDESDFWWQNNGITILASNVACPVKSMTLENPLIVNGLQTSMVIFRSAQTGSISEKRMSDRILVKVISTIDEPVRDSVIAGTNRQTRIPPAALFASNPEQVDIERYFESEGWYYERRRNYYKNKKVPAAKRIEMLFLAQAVMTLLLGEPNTARARPTTLLSKDEGYARVFTKDPDCEMYLIAARMLKEVDAFLKRRDSRESFDEPTNSRHYVLLAYYMFALGIKDVQRLHFAENARKVALPLDEDLLGKSLECVKAAFEAVRDSNPNLSIDTIAKGSSLVDMLVIELNKRLNCE